MLILAADTSLPLLSVALLRDEIVGGWHGGVRDLETFDSKGCGGLAGGLTDWSWDGTVYSDTMSLECPCPDGTNDHDRAPRCPRAPP